MSLQSPQTYLDLVQRLAYECGVASSAVPTTVVNATGQTADLCNWLAQADMEIQAKHPDWDFKRVSPGVSFATVAGQLIYTPAQAGVAAGVSAWLRNTFRVYNTAQGQSGEIRMAYWDYEDWRDVFQIGALRTSQVWPVNFTILPNLSLGVQCPLAGYTMTGDYFSVPVMLTADSDVPSYPTQFIMLPVYEAMKSYAYFESAPEVLARAEKGAARLWALLENGRLPQIYGTGELC
jgi:hypothetical protein